MMRLEVRGLTLRAPGGETLVDDLDLALHCGTVTVLMGPSGSGKSSVLGWLTGTLAPGFQARGQLTLDGRSLLTVPTERRRIGLMLQSDFLFPHMTVEENLLFGLRGGNRRARREQIRAFTWQRASALPVLLVTHDVADIPAGARVIEIGAGGRAETNAGARPALDAG